MGRIKRAFFSINGQNLVRRVLGVYWPPELPAITPPGSNPANFTPDQGIPELFEVNMMECLVGWKAWDFDGNNLRSPSVFGLWPTDRAFEAQCSTCRTEHIISEKDTCGIYATDSPNDARRYGNIVGQIWGWGRYIRGDKGWRAQWAYPKSFCLTRDQAALVEPLKKYHVPIFIDEPLRVYDPSEEGYILEADYGYGNTEAQGHSRTTESAHSSEEGDQDSEAAQGTT